MMMMKRLLFLLTVLLSSVATLWAQTETTYSPVLDASFRTGTGNTVWNSGFPKSAADDGNTDFELTYAAGFFALQKYTVPNIQNATKLVLTLTVGSKSGVDALVVWPFTGSNDWTVSSGVDDIVSYVTSAVGVTPRATEGTSGTPLATGKKVTDSNPAKATWTIQGDALATIKANASSDGTFTLLITNNAYTNSNSKRSYLSNNAANAEANRPTLVATTETMTVLNKTTGVAYKTLSAAAAALGDEDTELEVSDDQVLTGRITWNKAHTLTITPTKDITIQGQPGQMWFLANVDNAVFNIGSSDYTITLDGENKTYTGGDVAKFENKATISLTNVKFQNFDLNNASHLVGSKNNEGFIILDRITVANCVNPGVAYIYKARVNNDKLVLKGFLNFGSECVGTKIYCASEADSRAGRIKLDDSNFTASSPLTIEWTGEKKEGVIVVIKTTVANAPLFQLTDENWALERNANNGDLVMTAPATPTVQIGDKGYADLAAALAAVQDGETITLLADQEISTRVNIKNKVVTIDGQNKTIKRAASYANGLLFLTQRADEEGKVSGLTLSNVVLDDQNVETTNAMIEASNGGITVLNNVTIQNLNATAKCAVDNKSGGKLVLQGAISIPSIFVGKGVTASVAGATIASPIVLTTDSDRPYGLMIAGGQTADFTCAAFRLSQQMDGLYNMPLAVENVYAHPALLHTAADITAAKDRLTTEPYAAAYAALEGVSAGQAVGAVEVLKRMDKKNWEETYPDYNNYTRAADDAKLAYELGLRYQLKNSTASADAAVAILNDWATVNKGMLRMARKSEEQEKAYVNNMPDPNEYLMCIQGYQFANAAELLRDYTGWQAADKEKFFTWIKQTFADVAILFLENHHSTSEDANPLHYWLNWDLAALNAMYSIGVLTNDKALVDYAVNYVDNGKGNGNKANAVVATHQDTDTDETLAQCQESGRDQGHSTLDVSLLGVLCQTAENNGTDLWTPYKALEMAEYVAKYNLKTQEGAFVYTSVPFSEYTNGEVTHTVISEDQRGSERPCWELIHAYAKRNSKSDKYSEEWVKYYRTKNAGGETMSNTNDELGFGTLMFGAEVSGDVPSTGIQDVRSKMDDVRGEYFDLSGRRVAQPTKGLYITNGRKVVIK